MKANIEADFIPAPEFSQVSHFSLSSIYAQNKTKRGPVAHLLTRFGGKLGVWRSDWETFKASQVKLRPLHHEDGRLSA